MGSGDNTTCISNQIWSEHKSALSTFYAVLEGTLDHLSGKVLVLMLKHFY